MRTKNRSFLLFSMVPAVLLSSVFAVAQAAEPKTTKWSDPASWPNSKVPAAGDTVIIGKDRNVVLDVSPPALGGLSIVYGEMHRFIPALASDLGARIVEIPVHHRRRLAGTSKYGLSRTIRVVLDLVTVKFLSSYSTRPIQIFGVFGLLSTSVGLAITGLLGFERIFLGIELGDRPLVLLGILLTLMGFQFITMGLLGELMVRTYHESQGKPVYRTAEVRGVTSVPEAAGGAMIGTGREG
jgi:hypothetical protein